MQTYELLKILEDINEECRLYSIDLWETAEQQNDDEKRRIASDSQSWDFKDLLSRTLPNTVLLEIKNALKSNQDFRQQFENWFKSSYESTEDINILFEELNQTFEIPPVLSDVGEVLDFLIWRPEAPIWFQNWFSIECHQTCYLKGWQLRIIRQQLLNKKKEAQREFENDEISLSDYHYDTEQVDTGLRFLSTCRRIDSVKD
jgi:hypothetical protein